MTIVRDALEEAKAVRERIRLENERYDRRLAKGADTPQGDVERALLVLLWTPDTRLWLERHDPKAVTQAVKALRLDENHYLPSE